MEAIQWLGAPACGNDGTTWASDWQRLECEVLELVNQRRTQGTTCGGERMPPVGPLTRHQLLTQSSRVHAQDMGNQNYFEHYSRDGRSPFDRMQQAGFSGASMAENISAGQPTAAAVMRGWMDSPGHCKNIMTAGFKYLGVGYYFAPQGRTFKHLWVQNFGGAGGTPPPAAATPPSTPPTRPPVFRPLPPIFLPGTEPLPAPPTMPPEPPVLPPSTEAPPPVAASRGALAPALLAAAALGAVWFLS